MKEPCLCNKDAIYLPGFILLNPKNFHYLCIMKDMIYKLFCVILSAVALTGCSENGDEPDGPGVPRSVLVYMVANNSLGSSHFDTADIDEMMTAARQGDFGKSRLFVYHHAHNAQPVLKEITPEGERVIITYDTPESSVSSTRMNNVIADFKRLAPAQHHGIILWSHGSGWIENGMEAAKAMPQEDANLISPQSFGDDGGRYMNVTTLAKVLQGKGFDFIYFDCCYMAGVEVVYELRLCAPRIVASATELPARGMPYDETLRHLLKSNADLVAAARATFNFYNTLPGQARTCTISVIDTAGLEALADATRDIYSVNNTPSEGFSPQHFMTSACYIFDFGQYADDLASRYPTLRSNFDNAIENVVVYKASTPELWGIIPLTHHCGLSTYLPDFAKTNRFNYDNLQWASDVASALDR